MKSNLALPTILYQDAWFLAVDKPAGVIVHSDGTSAITLTDLVHQELLAQEIEDDASELQAINRLDRNTTGIVLFSLNKQTQPAFDASSRHTRRIRTIWPSHVAFHHGKQSSSMHPLPVTDTMHDACA